MKDKDFKNLVASIRQAGAIRRGERQFPPAPSRCRLGDDVVAVEESGQGGGEVDVKQPHRSDQ